MAPEVTLRAVELDSEGLPSVEAGGHCPNFRYGEPHWLHHPPQRLVEMHYYCQQKVRVVVVEELR